MVRVWVSYKRIVASVADAAVAPGSEHQETPSHSTIMNINLSRNSDVGTASDGSAAADPTLSS